MDEFEKSAAAIEAGFSPLSTTAPTIGSCAHLVVVPQDSSSGSWRDLVKQIAPAWRASWLRLGRRADTGRPAPVVSAESEVAATEDLEGVDRTLIVRTCKLASH